MRAPRPELAAYGPPALLLLLAVGFTAMTGQFSSAGRVVPRLVGCAVLALCAFDILSRGNNFAGRLVARWLNPAGLKEKAATPEAVRARRQAAAIGGIVGLVAAFVLAGMLPAVALFGLLAFRLGGGLGWTRSVALAGCLTAMVWLLFGVLLGLPPFPGLLFGGEW